MTGMVCHHNLGSQSTDARIRRNTELDAPVIFLGRAGVAADGRTVVRARASGSICRRQRKTDVVCTKREGQLRRIGSTAQRQRATGLLRGGTAAGKLRKLRLACLVHCPDHIGQTDCLERDIRTPGRPASIT